MGNQGRPHEPEEPTKVAVEEPEAGAGAEGAEDEAGEGEVWVVDDEDGAEEAGRLQASAGPGGEDRLARLESELAKARDQWVRTLADFDNYRKRSEREQRDLKRYALFEPMRDLLSVVDNLQRALAAGGEVEDLKRGVELILQQLREFLRNQGVREIPAAGAAFDPSQHDAVSRFEDPAVTTPTVAEELQRGYSLYERLLRPALVRVAMPPARSAAPPANQEEAGGEGGDGAAGAGSAGR